MKARRPGRSVYEAALRQAFAGLGDEVLSPRVVRALAREWQQEGISAEQAANRATKAAEAVWTAIANAARSA